MIKRFDWRLADDRLLAMRLCDLPVSVDAPFIAKHVRRLYRELESRGIEFRPHVWLADEWFSADGVPGFAIPFYLTHPRLMRLERKLLREVEGGNGNWMMRILRHEAGHAIDTAYRIRRRKDWREAFGSASQRYPTRYLPNPASHDHVQHLGSWYAQSHPTEDFAETFAIWLQPRSRWRREYAHWPVALKKLEYVDALMAELAHAKPKIRSRVVIDPLKSNKRTLRAHYRREMAKFAIESHRYLDDALNSLFVVGGNGQPGSTMLIRSKRAVLRRLQLNPGVRPYVVYNLMRALIDRSRELKLRTPSYDSLQDANFRDRVVKTVAETVLAHVSVDSGHHRRQEYAL